MKPLCSQSTPIALFDQSWPSGALQYTMLTSSGAGCRCYMLYTNSPRARDCCTTSGRKSRNGVHMPPPGPKIGRSESTAACHSKLRLVVIHRQFLIPLHPCDHYCFSDQIRRRPRVQYSSSERHVLHYYTSLRVAGGHRSIHVQYSTVQYSTV
ncbi:hypothetical protein BJV78DRAFT_738548 [Lactifluus subvellereus]|nr:hypothetical protein BJV78DRAFT_738548 [Lactifluus subvellereus]